MKTETFRVVVKSQGRIVVPYNIRRSLGLGVGDWVTVTIRKESVDG